MDLAQRHLPNMLTDMLERGHVVIEPFQAGETLPAAIDDSEAWRRWAAPELGLTIPDPHEVDVA